MPLKHLTVHAEAPAFAAADENGRDVSLSDFKGRPLVLYFYPKDDTPGCTKQACALRDRFGDLQARNAAVLGVSPDSSRKHAKFIRKYELPFSLLADSDHAICEAYGVWGERKFMGRKFMGVHRSLFVIDGNGQLAAVNYDIAPGDSVAAALQALEQLE